MDFSFSTRVILEVFVVSTSFCIPFFTFFWWVAERRKNANHADLLWSLFIVAFVWWWCSLHFAGVSIDGSSAYRQLLATALVSLWSLRLSSYLFFNRVLGENSEDGRYSKLRRSWGEKAPLGFWIIFQAQWILALLLSISVIPSLRNGESFPQIYDIAGILVFVTAVVGESVADKQLSNFKSKPSNKGKTCKEGLWRYSRHPNYFFEWLHWFSYVLFALGSTHWMILLSLLGPAAMLFVLWKITGIPVTEEQAKKSRPDYAEYQRTTSMLIPWPPKEDK